MTALPITVRPGRHGLRGLEGSFVRPYLLASLALLAELGQPDSTQALPAAHSLQSLKCLEPAELDHLFAAGAAEAIPAGSLRGQALIMPGKRCPRLSAWGSNLAWKGKVFADDGSFVNQWVGFRALGSCAAIGPSWYDGLPCLAIDYPPGSPIFGNVRDEIRAIAPGLYLGRLYECCPCPRLLGYFAMVRRG